MGYTVSDEKFVGQNLLGHSLIKNTSAETSRTNMEVSKNGVGNIHGKHKQTWSASLTCSKPLLLWEWIYCSQQTGHLLKIQQIHYHIIQTTHLLARSDHEICIKTSEITHQINEQMLLGLWAHTHTYLTHLLKWHEHWCTSVFTSVPLWLYAYAKMCICPHTYDWHIGGQTCGCSWGGVDSVVLARNLQAHSQKKPKV